MTADQQDIIKALQFALDNLKAQVIEAMEEGKDVSWSYTQLKEEGKNRDDVVVSFKSDGVPLFQITKF